MHDKSSSITLAETHNSSRPKRVVDLCLDSGAFSAWSHKEPQLNLKKYIKYVKRNAAYLNTYVTMDVIPGEFGVPYTQEQVQESAERSYRNLQIMRDAGLEPIAAFHQGESPRFLERMLKDGQKYIGVSIIRGQRIRSALRFLDGVFSTVTDARGRPTVKVHGFGMNNRNMLFRYPYFSVDSTTWLLAAGFGSIIVPPLIDGKLDYSDKPRRVLMSGVYSQAKTSQAHQFEALGPHGQKAVLMFLEEAGVPLAEARYGTMGRRDLCLYYTRRLSEHLTGIRLKTKTRPLFNFRAPCTDFPCTDIMYATHIDNHGFSWLLNKRNARSRLLSYYNLKDMSDDLLHEYVETGRLLDYSPDNKPPGSINSHNEAMQNYMRLQIWKRLKRYEADDGTRTIIEAIGDRSAGTI